MSHKGLHSVLQQARQWAGTPPGEGDAQLLQRFAQRHDEPAFIELLRRHGPMVLGVCRRYLNDWQAAEDAFQATFLVLACKAESLPARPTIGPWLHEVACRTARKARAQTLARPPREAQASPPLPTADPAGEAARRDLRAVLDEELRGLSQRYRQPLVLHYLESRSVEETARQLGCPVNTVKTRLARGREQLRSRLLRRGVELSLGTLATAPAAERGSAMPSSLLGTTLRHSLLVAAGAATAEVPLPVSRLAAGVLDTLSFQKVKLCVLLLGVLCVAAVGTTVAMQNPGSTPAPAVSVKQPLQQPPTPRTDLLGDPLPRGALARVGTNRLCAPGSINVVAFSRNGRLLAYGIEMNRVYVCEAATGKPVRQWKPGLGDQVEAVTEMAFSPDNRLIAVGGFWLERVRVFDISSGKLRLTIPNTAKGQSHWGRQWQGPGFTFTPDGRSLVVGGKDGGLHIWSLATGREAAVPQVTAEVVRSLTLTADGRTALTAHSGGELHLWDVVHRTHLRKLEATARYPQLTVLAPDGKNVVLAASTTDLEIWDPAGGERYSFHTKASLAGVGFARGGARLVVAECNGTITTWDTLTGRKITSLVCDGISRNPGDADRGPLPLAWFGADGKVMAWAAAPAVRPWDLTTGHEMVGFNPYRDALGWAGFLAGGRSLGAAGLFGPLGVWDAATGKALTILPHTRTIGFTTCTLAHDRRHVVVMKITSELYAGHGKLEDGRILLWDPSGKIGPVALRGQAAPARDAALTPDNRFVVASETTGQIRVYDARTQKPVRSFAGCKNEFAPVLSPYGSRLATLGGTGTIRIYDFATGHVLHVLKGPSRAQCLAISPDGQLLASGHSTEELGPRAPSDEICLWNLASGRKLRRIETPRIWVAQHLAFSPDGRLLASGSLGGVHLWETATGQERRRYKNDLGQVESVDFAPDGLRIVSAYTSGTALVWRVFEPGVSNVPAAHLETLWRDLARPGPIAHQAIGELIASKAAAFLNTHLKPAVQPSKAQWHEWRAQLASKSFAKRQAAEKALARVGEMFEPELLLALSTTTDAEVRRRLERVRANIGRVETRPEELRELRAVEVLEHLGTAEARQVLQKLAGGAPNARLSKDAKASLARFGRNRAARQ